MKILRISLSNLASLGGLHTVDFTRDPLRSSGLFSISGPTGSGKSTLLDALCLALYDDTPRLHQVGRLAELANGDRQNDPRSLLRRGTGEGFAEVAFVGVNDQSYTARWTVRRSRRLAEGTLQNVEMVLFKGHIEPGGEGQIEEGGRKTAVLKAIESRIGLTFQQFTRAVLLAQNDFATFLKSDDRERAEILQALTGTENFEEISKRVYSRCQSELKTLDGLHIQLAGLAPMDEPTRQAAELKHRAAIESLRAIEQRAALLQTSVDWYTAHRKLEQDKAAAENMWQDAVNADAAASPRRQTLQLTEEVLRDGRPLWDAERSASEIVARLSQACIQTRARSEALKTQRSDRVRIQCEATTKLQVLHAQQKENQPVLQYARKLDNTLRFRQSQLEQVSDEYRQASESAQRAAAALKIKTDERDTLLLMLDECLERRTKLIAVAAFSSERSRWTDRIDSLIQACSETKTARIEVEQLQTQAASLLSQLQIEQESLAPMTEALAAAGEALTAARLLESQFDANVLAEERTRLDALHDVLRQLFIHLRDAESLRQRATGIAEK
ncbi:MAG: AAA family ATPase, partial [Planctomycetota bacterium]